MSTYAIGDVQGCFDDLLRLLERFAYDERQDTLWFAGDLINRGPKSLETLRWMKSHNCVCILGNHDLHLLAAHYGFDRGHEKDSFHDILAAPDRDELIHWLRHRPLLHHEHAYTMVHAGIDPAWDLTNAQALAQEAETLLRSDHVVDFIKVMYGNEPKQWDENLSGFDRIRFIINTFTRIRVCDAQGKQDLIFKGAVETILPPYMPWFKVPDRQMAHDRIIIGHWAALGGNAQTPNIYALDTGCVWGNHLTGMRLSDQTVFTSE